MPSRKLILSLLGLVSIAPDGICQTSTAKIAAWNVASGRSKTGGTPIPQERIERLGKVLAEKIKPDVIVLEEVWPVGAAKDIAEAATKQGFQLDAVNMPAQETGVVQLISILKRPSVEVSEVELIKGSDDLVDGDSPDEQSSRKAVLAKVKVGKFDFYLIGVHLKSKIPGNGVNDTPLQMRDRQVRTIARRIDEVTSGPEKDVLILGDYNMTPEGEEQPGEGNDKTNFESLNPSGDLRFLSSEVKGPSHLGLFHGQIERSKLDGYAITKATEKEYRAQSFQILDAALLGATENQFADKQNAQFLSDHYPVAAEFDTDKDDD